MEQCKRRKTKLRNIISRPDVGVLGVTLLLFVCFSIFTEMFLSSYNLYNIFRTTALYIVIALSQSIVCIIGGLSLAVGAVGGLSGMVAGIAMENMGLAPFPAILIAIAVGALIGFIHGIIITKFKLSAFVVTLATQYIFTGLVLGITKGYPFINLPKHITTLGRGGIASTIPYLMIISIMILIILAYFFRYTITGRRILSTGGNKEAARLSGIPVTKINILCHVMSGLFSAIAAMLYTMRLGSIQAKLGSDWMLISFAVTVIASSNNGRFSALGIFSSALMMTLIKNGLTILKVDIYYEQAFLGLIILFAVALDSFRSTLNDRKMVKLAAAENK